MVIKIKRRHLKVLRMKFERPWHWKCDHPALFKFWRLQFNLVPIDVMELLAMHSGRSPYLENKGEYILCWNPNRRAID